MEIRDRTILILGGWGLVGTAILHQLGTYRPKKIVILSLHQSEAADACEAIRPVFPEVEFVPEWGNIFVRRDLKDLSRTQLLENAKYRNLLMSDTLEPFDEERMDASFLHQVISSHKPNIIIDAVNTSTALAYQDIYSSYYKLKETLASDDQASLKTDIEKMMTTLYIPQIIRHIQVLHASMVENKTGIYIKIGTTGTGGMGLNIPYTHSEERPSRVLLSKTSLAGAHTMLLFLMGRTPGGPICKEIKPAAAIAWKSIGYGEVKKHGQPIPLYDCPPEKAETLNETFNYEGRQQWTALNETLKSVYIDTGENGIFSNGEFETITTVGQMEFVTPEEIAENVILEIQGDATGYDIISALDHSIMGPTYRAGYIRHQALDRMEDLMQKHNAESVAFEILGPPRLSKLLYEAHLINKVCGDFKCALLRGPDKLAGMLEEYIHNDAAVRSTAISIGIPILMQDGKSLLRGPQIKIPVRLGAEPLTISPANLDEWANAGWIDLRPSNMVRWQQRIQEILDWIDTLSYNDTSSKEHHGIHYWNPQKPMKIGKVAAWIFMNEDKGIRFKR